MGNAFNIGAGFNNSLSILELFEILERKLDVKINYKSLNPRESDQKVFIADIKKIKSLTKWEPLIDKEKGIELMLEWIYESAKNT
jgi:CDP-paratose 2-epimerase